MNAFPSKNKANSSSWTNSVSDLIFHIQLGRVTFLIISFMFGGSATYLHITLSEAAKQNKVSP
jgi:hypothetical protein